MVNIDDVARPSLLLLAFLGRPAGSLVLSWGPLHVKRGFERLVLHRPHDLHLRTNTLCKQKTHETNPQTNLCTHTHGSTRTRHTALHTSTRVYRARRVSLVHRRPPPAHLRSHSASVTPSFPSTSHIHHIPKSSVRTRTINRRLSTGIERIHVQTHHTSHTHTHHTCTCMHIPQSPA